MFWLNVVGRRPSAYWQLRHDDYRAGAAGAGVKFRGIILVVAAVAFAVYAFFSGGPGILQWLYPNELFPTDIRASPISCHCRIGTIVPLGITDFYYRYGINNVMLIGALISLVGLGVGDACPGNPRLDANTDRKHDFARNAIDKPR